MSISCVGKKPYLVAGLVLMASAITLIAVGSLAAQKHLAMPSTAMWFGCFAPGSMAFCLSIVSLIAQNRKKPVVRLGVV